MSRMRKLALVGLLYTGQDVVFTFFLVTLVGILRQRGISLEQLAAISLVSLVWSVRFLWAPVIDRFGWKRFGHYRSWVIATQALMVCIVVGMAFLDPIADLRWLLGAVVVLVLASATQENAVNALGVLLLGPRDRAAGTGLLLGGVYVGTLFGGGGVLLVYGSAGWPVAMVFLSTVVALPMLAVIGLREPKRTSPVPRGSAVARIFGGFRNPGVLRWIAMLIPLYVLGGYAADAIMTPLLVGRWKRWAGRAPWWWQSRGWARRDSRAW